MGKEGENSPQEVCRKKKVWKNNSGKGRPLEAGKWETEDLDVEKGEKEECTLGKQEQAPIEIYLGQANLTIDWWETEISEEQKTQTKETRHRSKEQKKQENRGGGQKQKNKK